MLRCCSSDGMSGFVNSRAEHLGFRRQLARFKAMLKARLLPNGLRTLGGRAPFHIPNLPQIE